MSETISNNKNTDSSEHLLESIPVGIIVFDETGIIRNVTENFFRFSVSGYSSPADLLDKNIFEIDVFRELEIKDDLAELKKGYGFEKTLLHQKTLDGGKLSVIIKAAPVFADSEYLGGILLVEDVKTSTDSGVNVSMTTEDIKNTLSKIFDSVVITDGEGTIKNISEKISFRLTEIFGIAEGEDIKKNLPGHISEKLISIFEHPNTSSLLNETFEFDELLINLKVVVMQSGRGSKPLFILLFNDQTDSNDNTSRSEAELEELRKYQQIASTVVDAVINVDGKGNINFWNESAEKLFGFTRSAVYGKFIGKILPHFNEKYFAQVKEELRKSSIWESRIKIGSSEKTEYFQLRLGLLEDEQESIVILCTNITRQVQIERRIRQSEERYRDIVLNTPEYICTIDLTGKINYVNPYFISQFSYSEEEFSGKNFTELIEEEYLKKNGFDLDSFTLKKIQTMELPLLKKDGSLVYVVGNFSIVTDLNDKPKYYNAILTDITTQKESERDLMLVKSVFEVSNEGIAVSSKRKLILVNEKFVKMFGYENSEELIGLDPLDMVANNDIPRVAKNIEDLEKNTNKSMVYEYVALKKNETTFYAENSTISYQTDSNSYIVSIIRDVTEEKRSQLALAESEERYRSITENISETLWTAERHNNKLEMVFYTSGVKKITGYSQQEFLGNKRLWVKIIHPMDVGPAIARFKRLYRDSARSKDEINYRIIDKEGGIVWIRNKVNVIRNESGDIEKVFGFVSDISLSKRAEEELKESAENLKKLNDTKDKFISIVSHDLRTPFSSIIGFAELLMDKDLENEKRDQYAKFILESSKSMLNLVNSLLDWTRLQTGRLDFEPRRVNAKSIIASSYQMVAGAAINKNIRILNDVIHDVFIHADHDLLIQVFNNLLSNAIKFTNSGGKIIVGAFPMVEKMMIKFSVKDEGVGIKEEDLKKLFKVESKFTLAGTAGEKGSGLGLSLCYDIVKKHGGDIWIESVYGEGTDFLFTIPISSTKILLVDDSGPDKILYSKLIKSMLPNYTIETADNGKEALNKIKLSQPVIVITDHKMPVMNGYEFVERLHREKLNIMPPVIVLSGDVTEGIKEDYKELGVEYVFNKPVEISKFKHALEDSLKKAIFT